MVSAVGSFFHHLLDWTGAVMRAWWGLAAAIVAGLAATAHDRIAATPLNIADLGVAVAVGLPVAFFQAWREERIGRDDARAKLSAAESAATEQRRELMDATSALVSVRQELDQERQRNTPDIRGGIGTQFFQEVPTDPPRLIMLLSIMLRNMSPGSASAISGWRASLATNGQGSEVLGLEGFTVPITFQLPTGAFTVQPEDDIVSSTAARAIGPGEARAGYLALFPTNKTIASVNGATLTVEFADVRDKVHTMSAVLSTTKLDPMISVLAGTKARFEMSPEALREKFLPHAQAVPQSLPTAPPETQRESWLVTALRVALSIASRGSAPKS